MVFSRIGVAKKINGVVHSQVIAEMFLFVRLMRTVLQIRFVSMDTAELNCQSVLHALQIVNVEQALRVFKDVVLLCLQHVIIIRNV
jgi:hypothetical protein